MKFLFSSFLFIYSLNSFAASPVLVTVNDTDISQAAVENFMQHFKKSVSFKDALSEMITIEALVAHRLKTPIAKDSILQLELERSKKAMIAADALEIILAGLQMSEDELRAEYQKQYLSPDTAKEYNANHILVKTENEALAIISELNNKADFEVLAKQHSTGPSSKTGGALGWFDLGKMVKPFSAATAALKKGEHSQAPTKTQFGWHVIKLNDLREKVIPSLESVAAQIKRRYSALKLSDEIQKIHNAANIVIHSQ